ncbi:DUF4174 domain-containing protein [Glaciecola sp. MH2013]|uniref:DUF4174 domain-containing protein n=1 Tax=Glaciecola sp. MH2013 TaxID=2785524 RepID=UPI00189F5786|nr:DUF4174 domain-containing protein [Glaciecola sp. MH2013]MBF7073568.1 DUF4174 domain-containing protein [Glaciecola sp. MH2013]
MRQLSDFQWKHRVVASEWPADKQAQRELLQLLTRLSEDLKERKLYFFFFSGELGYELSLYLKENQPPSFEPILNKKLEEALHNQRKQHHTVLIGLDGGRKQVYDSFNLEAIVADIERMPMRRAELK